MATYWRANRLLSTRPVLRGALMDSISKLRAKVGIHEFEAEGPAEQVTAQYEAWRSLIEKAPQAAAPTTPSVIHPSIPPSAITEVRTREGFTAPWDIFNVEKNIISLRVHPPAGDT